MRDSRSFDEFYRAHALRMLQYCYAITGDRTDAQDISQEAFARAWGSWATLAEHPAPEAWLRLVIARLATDGWRRLRSMRLALARGGPTDPVRPPSEDTVVLVEALRKLPTAQRRALAMHYLLDMSIEQIASETGAAPGTVRSWLSRGRARLAQPLGDFAPGRATEVNDAN